MESIIEEDFPTAKAEDAEESSGDVLGESIISSTTTTTISTTTVIVEEKTSNSTVSKTWPATAGAISQENMPTSGHVQPVFPLLPLPTALPVSESLPQKGFYMIYDEDGNPVGEPAPFGVWSDSGSVAGNDDANPDNVEPTSVGDKVNTGDDEDAQTLFVGLRVYTKKNAVVTITGRVRDVI